MKAAKILLASAIVLLLLSGDLHPPRVPAYDALIQAAKDADEPDTALLLAAEGYQFSTDIEAERILFKQTKDVRLVGYLREPKAISSLALTDDGSRLVVGSGDGELAVVDVADGSRRPLRASVVDHGLALWRDSLLAAADKSGQVVVWDLADARERYRLSMPGVTTVALSADGTRLAAAGDGQLLVVTVSSGEPILRKDLRIGAIESVEFSPSGGLLAVGGREGTTVLLDTARWNTAGRLPNEPPAPVYSLAFAAENLLVAGLGDGTRATWSLDPVRRRERVPEGLATSTPPKDVAYLWDQPATVEPLSGNLFVYGRRASDKAELGGLEIWSYSPLRRAKPDVELSSLGIRSDVLALARSRQLVAVGSASGLIALIDLRRPMLIPAQLNSPIQFSPDGGLVAYAGEDRSVRVLGDGLRQVASFRLDGGDYVTTLAWNRDGTRLAAGSRGGQFAAWDLASAERVWSTSLPKGDSRLAWAVTAFSPDGDAIAYGFQKTVRIVDVVDGEAWPGKLVTPGPVLSLAFDPRGRFLATAGDYSVRLWSLHDLRTAEEVRYVSLPGEGQNFPTAVGTSGDGALVAWHNLPSQTMTLWDVDGFRVIREFHASGTGIDDVALTADGGRLVTSDSDGGATLWDVRYTDPVGSMSDQTTVRSRGPGRLAVDRGGDRFAMSFPDGILISEIGPRARVRAACGLLGRVAASHPQLRSAHACRAGIR